jgi:hypothetical protein
MPFYHAILAVQFSAKTVPATILRLECAFTMSMTSFTGSIITAAFVPDKLHDVSLSPINPMGHGTVLSKLFKENNCAI